jgi:hypothetical protein
LSLPAGRHVVDLTSPTNGQRRRVFVDVIAAGTARVRERLDGP